MSLLNKALEKYLIWRQINKEENTTEIKLARAYRDLNLTRHFLKTTNEIKKKQAIQLQRNADFLSKPI